MTTEPSLDMEIDSTTFLKMHLQTSLQEVPTTLPSVASGTKADPLQVVQLPKWFTIQI